MLKVIEKMAFLSCLAALSGCVTADEIRKNDFVRSENGESIYKIWTYKEYQIKGKGDQICPRGWREIGRSQGQTDMRYVGPGIFIRLTRIETTIACPNDHPK
jgi:hypothetical protein